MERTYLILENNVVVDAQVWDDANLPDGVDMIEHVGGMNAWVGWTRVAGELVAPPEPPAAPVEQPDAATIAAVLAYIAAQGTTP